MRPAAIVRSIAPTIFHEQWWLDITTGGQCGVVEIIDNGKCVGRLPHFIRTKYGLRHSLPPTMAHIWGPAVDEGHGNPCTRAYNRAWITRELIAKLPPAAIYHYKCESALMDVYPFVQQGFVSSVQFTQEILPSDPSIIWAGMSKKKRSQIRRAQAVVKLSLIDDPERFWNFYDANLERRGERNYYTKLEVESCIKQVLSRQCGRIYAAKDLNNNLVAAVLCIWDRRTTYYYMSSRTAAAHDGAISLLLWQAIQDAAKAGLIFDFDGLNDIASAEFCRGFGGRMVPRLNVIRASAMGRLAWKFMQRSGAPSPLLRGRPRPTNETVGARV